MVSIGLQHAHIHTSISISTLVVTNKWTSLKTSNNSSKFFKLFKTDRQMDNILKITWNKDVRAKVVKSIPI